MSGKAKKVEILKNEALWGNFLDIVKYSKLPPSQQPDDFGYVNNRPKVLRVTNFHNLYLYISVHITIKKNNSTIIVYSPQMFEPFNVVLRT